MGAKVAHCKLAHLEQEGPQFLISGKTLQELSVLCEGRPFYAYSRQLIEQRVARLRNALPDKIQLHYAVKANPMPAVIQCFRPLVDGFDVASQIEMRHALDSGMPAAEISFAGPGKREPEIHAAILNGVTLNAESIHEIRVAAKIGEKTGRRPKIALRVNPAFELKGSGMKMTGSPRQFGIDEELIPEAMQFVKDADLHFRGLHVYSGSQNLKSEAIIEANQQTFLLAEKLCRAAEVEPEFLNIGGGYGIPYFPGDQELELQPVCENLDAELQTIPQRLGNCEIVVELGRYLVGEAGFYVCKIVDRKLSKGHVFGICDGGLHHHLANSGNFGQVIRKNYPVLIGNRIQSEPSEVATLVGPLCTPLDTIADKMELPCFEIGDYVVVAQSGAYGPSASPGGFLSHPEVVEILV